ncbi:MAG: extracellular solute-binding protein [Deltaproteobacteria bacterium]|nr:extracellular solute-binding protein [Deltaproteobacteria bacterium]
MAIKRLKVVSPMVFLFVVFIAFAAAAAPREILEQARKEGEVVLYSTMPVGEFQVFSQAAKEKYPFLSVRHVRLSSSNQISRVMLEHRAGKLQADVVGNNLSAILYYKGQGILVKHESAEVAHVLKGMADPEGYWSAMTTDMLITGFNTTTIGREKAPKSFEDYLDPRLKGQMGINRGAPYALIGMIELHGEERGIAYMKRLGQQSLRPVEGFAHMTNLLAAGEYPVAIFMQVSKIDAMKKKGGPVNWVPTSPTFATPSAVAVTRQAPHPSAARLLVDFYLSVEGQQALVRAAKIPLRRGIKSASADIDQLLDGNLHVIRTEDYSRYQQIYNDALGIR